MKRIVFLAVFMVFLASFVSAFNTTAFQLGIWAPQTQLVPEDIDVSGLKINLPYGSNQNVAGIDIGFVSINDNVAALQLNWLNVSNDSFSGIQFGIVNLSGASAGLSFSFFNSTESISKGVDLAFINTALEHRGVQIGLINYTEFLTGVQLGLVNIATKSTLPFFPFINFCF